MYVIVYEELLNRVNFTISVSRNGCTVPWINAPNMSMDVNLYDLIFMY